MQTVSVAFVKKPPTEVQHLIERLQLCVVNDYVRRYWMPVPKGVSKIVMDGLILGGYLDNLEPHQIVFHVGKAEGGHRPRIRLGRNPKPAVLSGKQLGTYVKNLKQRQTAHYVGQSGIQIDVVPFTPGVGEHATPSSSGSGGLSGGYVQNVEQPQATYHATGDSVRPIKIEHSSPVNVQAASPDHNLDLHPDDSAHREGDQEKVQIRSAVGDQIMTLIKSEPPDLSPTSQGQTASPNSQ